MSLNTEWELSMATNGILNRTKREYIKEHLSWLSLSFDGPEDIQNSHRPFPSGKASYPIVYETAKYFHETKMPFAIRATVSAKSVNRLLEIIEFFNSEFPSVGIGIEPLHKIGRGCTSSAGAPDMRLFATEFIKVMKYAKEKKIKLVNSGVGRSNEIRTSFCKSLSSPAFNVSFDGNLTACQRDGGTLPEFKYGEWNKKKQKFEWDENQIRSVRKIATTLEPKCIRCFARYHCAGDCLDIKLAGSNRCEFNREIVRHFLTERLSK